MLRLLSKVPVKVRFAPVSLCCGREQYTAPRPARTAALGGKLTDARAERRSVWGKN